MRMLVLRKSDNVCAIDWCVTESVQHWVMRPFGSDCAEAVSCGGMDYTSVRTRTCCSRRSYVSVPRRVAMVTIGDVCCRKVVCVLWHVLTESVHLTLFTHHPSGDDVTRRPPVLRLLEVEFCY